MYKSELAFKLNQRLITSQNTIDFIKFRQNGTGSKLWNDAMVDEVMGKSQE